MPAEVTSLDLLTLAIASGGLVLGILAELRHRRADRVKLKFVVQHSMPLGIPGLHGRDFLSLTVTNVGARPVGVNSIAFTVSDKRSIPLMHQPPNAERLGAVLSQGESRTAWAERTELKLSLATERVTLVDCLANLSDGTTVRQPVPQQFRRG